jgi:rhodanese-related sulfurtransferase
MNPLNPNKDSKMNLKSIIKEIENGEAKLLDVREEFEWYEKRFAFAVNMPLTEIKDGEMPVFLHEYDKIYTHCQAGKRAIEASRLLTSQYPNIIALACSFSDLEEAGLKSQE